MTQKPTNPLDVTWIRIRISQYVTPKDALACVLVSKDWSEDFIPSIWHTVDFDVHRKFTGLTTEAISKHGHHIRVMKNLKSNDQTAAVQNSSIYKLVSLSMTLNLTLHFQACCYDILRRNIARLEHVSISKQSPSELYLFVDALSPSASDNASSRLSSLKLDGISMTQDAFSSLLRMSPALVKLEMRDTKLSVVSSTEPYQHPNVIYLVAAISQVFCFSGNQSSDFPSLFVYFPNLRTWETWSPSSSTLGVSVQTIKDEISRYCPLLKKVYSSLPGYLLADFLVKGFEDLKCVCLLSKSISSEVAMAVLSHRGTLESFRTFLPSEQFYTSNDVHPVDNLSEEHGWAIQTMLQLCSHMRTITISQLEMDMCDIEGGEWACSKLRHLRIRVRGLDTKEKIDRAIKLWIDGRNKQSQIHVSDAPLTSGHGGFSLEERVARHLLKFEKLKEVWLGTYVCKVA